MSVAGEAKSRRCAASLALLVALVAVFALVVPALAAQRERSYRVGPDPFFVATGDFNRDGNPDLAVANQGPFDPMGQTGNDTISVLLGRRDGIFRPARTYSVGNGPTAIAVGDFNRDGRQDLAVTNGFSGNVSILAGRGDGSFRPARNFEVGPAPYHVEVGDFNEDGHQDLAVASFAQPGVILLLGRHHGTFGPPRTVPTGPSGTPSPAASVADVNGDGHDDLVTTNGSGVLLLLGRGNATFRSPRFFATGKDAFAVAVGDLNGDERPDLAVANQHDTRQAGGFHSTVAVLLNKGHGRFHRALKYSVGRGPETVAIGDLNGDDVPDLAVANNDAQGSPDPGDQPKVKHDYVSILYGVGGGRFAHQHKYHTAPGPLGVVVRDFNHDDEADLAVAIEGRARVRVRLSP